MTERVRKSWTRWGSELRKLRDLAGLSQEELGRELLISRQLVGKLENGNRTPSRTLANKADDALATGGTLTALLEEISVVRDETNEWRDFLSMERAALEIREWQLAVIPGLLQCPDYARTLLRRNNRDPKQLDNAVETRVSRLDNLNPATNLRFVLDEPILSRGFGPPKVMRSQLDHLLTLIQSRDLHVVLVPSLSPWRPATSSAFRLASLPGGKRVVHVEYERGQAVIDDSTPDDIDAFASLFSDLASEALPRTESAQLIEKIRSDLE